MGALTRAVLVLALLAFTPAARADEGELQLGVEPTYAMLRRPDMPDAHGVGAAIDARLGLAPAAWLFAGAGVHHAPDSGVTVYEAAFGVTAALDVLRVVPFVEAAIAFDFVGDDTFPVLRAAVGADYLVTPAFAIGAVGRQRFFFGDEGEGLLTLSLRATWRLEID